MVADIECASLSTKGLNPKEAKVFWADHVGEVCFGSQWDFLNEEIFDASAEYSSFGLGKISHCEVSGYKNKRMPHHISRDGCDDFLLNLVMKGSVRVSSSNTEIVQKKSSIIMVDSGERLESFSHEKLELVSISFDRTWLTGMVGEPENLLMRDIASSSNWGKALAYIMSELRPQSLGQLALPPIAVAEHIAALLALSAWPPVESLRSSRRSLLDRLRRDMRARLSDSSLDTTRFAHEHGISVRTLHAAFAASGTSFISTLISMRLDRAHSLLEDRRFNNKTIAEIAHLVGFSNADHFSVRFRNAYGMPPSAFRTLRHGYALLVDEG
jgi:AraC family transcriptional regulator, positive regulator of tynA and feaB